MDAIIKDMLSFIDTSPTAFHTVKNIEGALIDCGFTSLLESEKWNIEKGGKYYVKRNSSSIVAFEIGEIGAPFMICATHSDFPLFKVKEERGGAYCRIATEKYGGMIMYSWFDRPLSIAGRVVIREGDTLTEKLVNIDRDLLVIPSVAIHQMRGVNDGFSPNAAVDTLPLLAISSSAKLSALLSRELMIDADKIVSHDLFVYPRDKGTLIGIDSELILSPRIDNLECVYLSLDAFLKSEKSSYTKVYAVFDNEEVGSESKQGAGSTLLADTLERISPDRESYFASVSGGFMVSADNAHARHPAHTELSDPTDAPILSGGVVIKHNANQRYATDAISSAIFEKICTDAGVKVQHYYNRADMPGGSTLGTISNTKVPISTVDIGLAQLAMHSAVETAAVSDAKGMSSALTRFYSARIEKQDSKIIVK